MSNSLTKGVPYEVIISLTSFPARIGCLPEVLDSLLRQTVRADRIILWLAEEQFPGREKDLPAGLMEMFSGCDTLQLRWCDDLRPHKKYYYTMKENPDSIVITVDDDVYYAADMVETLLDSYAVFPYAVSAMRAHKIVTDDSGAIAPYSQWIKEYNLTGIPSLALCATGVGGVLYPPHTLPEELFNTERIRETCLNADDLWLKAMEVINHVPVVVAAPPKKLQTIDDSQKEALWKQNDNGGANNTQFAAILAAYDNYWGETDTLTQRMRLSSAHLDHYNFSREREAVLRTELRERDETIHLLRSSWSYRIGRLITLIPRKIQGGVRCITDNGMKYTFMRILEKLKLKEVEL